MIEATKQVVEFTSSEHATPSGALTVAAPKAFLSIVLQPLVTPFLTKYPDIQLKLKASDGEIDLVSEGIDVVFRLTEKPSEGLVLKQVGKVSLSYVPARIISLDEAHLSFRQIYCSMIVFSLARRQRITSGILLKTMSFTRYR